jgi:hypothetical protein
MPDSNVDVVRRWNQENWDPAAVHDLVAPDFVAHMPDEEVHGADGWLAFVQRISRGARDNEAGVDEMMTSGDLVGERWWMHYTDADGHPVRWRGITMHKVADGRLQEDWVVSEEEH